MLYFRFVLSAVFFWSVDTHAADFCVENWACSEVRKDNGKLQIWLINQRDFPITMTLRANSRGYQSQNGQQNRYTRTVVLKGQEQKVALELTPVPRRNQQWYNYEFSWSPGDMNARHDRDHLYLRPYPPANKVRLVQGFGGAFSHRGASRYALDFAMAEGSEVLAARDGIVMDTAAHHNKGGPDRSYAEYANFISILHNDGTMGEYYHLQYRGVLVKPGDKIVAGQLIGYSGNTGFSSLPHLHFAVYKARPHGEYQSVPIAFAPQGHHRRLRAD